MPTTEAFRDTVMWFTDQTIPDPDPLPPALFWRVIVRPIPPKEKTKGGIIIPDKTKDELEILNTCGRVLAIGPLAFQREDMLLWGKKTFREGGSSETRNVGTPKEWYKVGDYVTYQRYAGKKLTYGGVRLIIMNDDEVLTVLPDPAKFLE